ncbi:MAG: hypothetical protein KF819_04705 [Labilithrix sp.]|nr:hypothetical protein [Labilithrix sp.]
MRLLRIAFVVAASALLACSLLVDTSGLSEPPRDVDGGSDVRVAVDAPADVDRNDAEAGASCVPTSIVVAPLTADLGTLVGKGYQVGSYPKVESFFGSPAAVLYPFVDVTPKDAGPDAEPIVAPELLDSHSGLWLPTPVDLRAFDVDVDVHVRCTSASSCADGVILAWLDTIEVAKLANTTNGHPGGLPDEVGGGLVILDDYRNEPTETADPEVPAIHVARLDATKALGYYPWNVASRPTTFLGAWHRIGVRVRGAAVTVLYDGATWLTSTSAAVTRGLFGITGGAGGESNAAAVRNLEARFYDCVP